MTEKKVNMANEADAVIAYDEKTFLTDFIGCYRAERCLWDCSLAEYKNKEARKEAILKMLKVMRSFVPSATSLDVKRKINSLRSSYRRELVNMKAANKDTPYQPGLWYFNIMDFLRGAPVQAQEDNLNGKGLLSPNSVKREPSEADSSVKQVEVPPKVPKLLPTKEVPQKVSKLLPTEEVPPKVAKLLSTEEVPSQTVETNIDEAKTLAMIWARKLRGLPRTQRIFAERAVNEILFHAEMGMLTMEGLQKISAILAGN